MSATQPTAEQLEALKGLPSDRPVVMVNLLSFRADGGEQRYEQYGREVGPHLERVGARVLYTGSTPVQVIGDGDAPWWDAVLIVEYPTPGAFLEMVTSADYLKVHEHREAALERGDLIATAAWPPAAIAAA
jgi:uncharacterized protein (DUF1330 family)